ncbi:MerR family transcriptional regulator [Paraburkholderia sp. CNPSo 3274]|uniref:MerR family transcriptional regulator n=1 Tax=Paraburkholderia sp. CNPSo 3274 TaxID=2940932 RepID=UPI0020B6F77E|nr:MerR family transcriptional regulator [Paraburkholderia sp. CNPSo 3274]MCP3707689.1 MerR family transcriptional regulator [Paraburkholderia sp. CNPSo 3274]
MTRLTRFTPGRLAREAGLSRSSLLHYEALGSLIPISRSAAGYRLYDETQHERLRAICAYRAAGLSLAAIRDVLASEGNAAAHILEAHLMGLTAEIARLKQRQKAIATLLAQPSFRQRGKQRGKDAWVALLRRAGFDEAEMDRWHAGFEAENPDSHAAFLTSLGLTAEEVKVIRRRAKLTGDPPSGHVAS